MPIHNKYTSIKLFWSKHYTFYLSKQLIPCIIWQDSSLLPQQAQVSGKDIVAAHTWIMGISSENISFSSSSLFQRNFCEWFVGSM